MKAVKLKSLAVGTLYRLYDDLEAGINTSYGQHHAFRYDDDGQVRRTDTVYVTESELAESQRRKRNASTRARNAVLRDSGMRRTRYGWE